VVLGIFSARSQQEAYWLAFPEIPQAAFECYDIEADPERFGIRAYRLAKEEGV
jgi:hypothetical protein